MNKNWKRLITIFLLLGFIFSGPKHPVLAQTLSSADLTQNSTPANSIHENPEYAPASGIADFTFSSTPNPSNYGQEVTFTLAATGSDPTYPPFGYVNFYDNGDLIETCENVRLNLSSSSMPVSDQPAICTTSSLSAGTHTITADFNSLMSSVYPDDTLTLNEGQSVNEPILLTVEPLILPDAMITVTYQRMLIAYYPGGVVCNDCSWWKSQGDLPVGLGINTETGEIIGTPNSAGSYTFTMSVEDGNGAIGSKEYTLNVTTVSTIVDVGLSSTTFGSIDPTTLGATARHPNPTYEPRPTGKMSFSVNGIAVPGCSGTDAKVTNLWGDAYCTSFLPTGLSAGSYQIDAEFTPDVASSELYQSRSGIGTLQVTLPKVTPVIAIFISTPTYFGHPFNLRASVRTGGGSPVSGSVDFTIDDEPVAVCQDVLQDEFGDYFCQNVSLPLLVGEHTLSASFTPTDTDTYNPVSGSIPFTVQSGSYLISGIIFNDSNQDSLMDTTEYGISSWAVNLTTCDGDPVMGTNGSVIGTQVTGYFGLFTFTNVPGGQCIHITEEIQTGWQATTPTQMEVTLSQDVHLLHFGNYYPNITVNLVGDTLPDGNVGEIYGPESFTATGGEGPYTYTIKDGWLPDGLELSLDGVLSGTPTLAGEFFFSVQAEDQNQAVGYQYFIITVLTEDTYTLYLPFIMK